MLFRSDRAVEIIRGGSNIHFDPIIVDAFMNVEKNFLEEFLNAVA